MVARAAAVLRRDRAGGERRPRQPFAEGLDTLRVLGPNRVAYLDLTGSGVETIAHVRENGRITLMACAFSGNPRISRIYGTGTVHELGSTDSTHSRPSSRCSRASRSIIEIDVDRVSTRADMRCR